MNNKSYIIQKLDNIFTIRKIQLKNINIELLEDIFNELEWKHINDIIPDVLEYYNKKKNNVLRPKYKLITHFKFWMETRMSQIKTYIDNDIDKESSTFTMYNDCYTIYKQNMKLILRHFNDILEAFEIVNIKYDRMNFLPFDFVLYKILTYMKREDLTRLIGLNKLKCPHNVGKLNKFWDEIEIELGWNH